jgi:hypothetical protein
VIKPTSYRPLGVREVDDGIWLASFIHYDLGYFDLEDKTSQPLDNPFGTRLSPYVCKTQAGRLLKLRNFSGLSPPCRGVSGRRIGTVDPISSPPRHRAADNRTWSMQGSSRLGGRRQSDESG